VNQNGLTLLEALVGLAVMAALVTVLVPFMQPKSGANLDLAARQIAVQLRQTQNAAIRNSRPAEIVIDIAAGRVGHDRIAQTKPPITLSLRTVGEQRRGTTAGAIQFFPDGGSTGGGITLTQGTRRMEIVVDWLTGRISTVERQP
jgi:general secretion pathway protein H